MFLAEGTGVRELGTVLGVSSGHREGEYRGLSGLPGPTSCQFPRKKKGGGHPGSRGLA